MSAPYNVDDEVDYGRDQEPKHGYRVTAKSVDSTGAWLYTIQLDDATNLPIAGVPDGLIRPHVYTVGDEVIYLNDSQPGPCYAVTAVVVDSVTGLNKYTIEQKSPTKTTIPGVPDGLIRPHVS